MLCLPLRHTHTNTDTDTYTHTHNLHTECHHHCSAFNIYKRQCALQAHHTHTQPHTRARTQTDIIGLLSRLLYIISCNFVSVSIFNVLNVALYLKTYLKMQIGAQFSISMGSLTATQRKKVYIYCVICWCLLLPLPVIHTQALPLCIDRCLTCSIRYVSFDKCQIEKEFQMDTIPGRSYGVYVFKHSSARSFFSALCDCFANKSIVFVLFARSLKLISVLCFCFLSFCFFFLFFFF